MCEVHDSTLPLPLLGLPGVKDHASYRLLTYLQESALISWAGPQEMICMPVSVLGVKQGMPIECFAGHLPRQTHYSNAILWRSKL